MFPLLLLVFRYDKFQSQNSFSSEPDILCQTSKVIVTKGLWVTNIFKKNTAHQEFKKLYTLYAMKSNFLKILKKTHFNWKKNKDNKWQNLSHVFNLYGIITHYFITHDVGRNLNITYLWWIFNKSSSDPSTYLLHSICI